MDPIECTVCGTTVWTTVESGEYADDVWLYTEVNDYNVDWKNHEEFNQCRGTWSCENGHVGSVDAQNALEDRMLNA